MFYILVFHFCMSHDFVIWWITDHDNNGDDDGKGLPNEDPNNMSENFTGKRKNTPDTLCWE